MVAQMPLTRVALIKGKEKECRYLIHANQSGYEQLNCVFYICHHLSYSYHSLKTHQPLVPNLSFEERIGLKTGKHHLLTSEENLILLVLNFLSRVLVVSLELLDFLASKVFGWVHFSSKWEKKRWWEWEVVRTQLYLDSWVTHPWIFKLLEMEVEPELTKNWD